MNSRNFKGFIFSQGGLVCVLLVVLVGWVFFKGADLTAIDSNWKIPSGVEFLKSMAGAADSVGSAGDDLNPDIDSAAFDNYAKYLGLRESISLTIIDTATEFEISARPGEKPGTGSFLVVPQKPHIFGSADIAALVRDGLLSVPNANDRLHAPKWASWTIATNRADRAWEVSLRGIAGAGKIRLAVGEASAELDVSLPRLLPIWRYARFADPRRGIVVVGGHDVPVGETILPDLSRGLCGFRVHSVSNRAVWFETVYSTPNPALERRLWPDLRIDYGELFNGQSFSKVVFESGHEMKVNDMAVFDEQGDALKLDADSFKLDPDSPLGERAVRFRYLDRHGALVADMIVVTFQ